MKGNSFWLAVASAEHVRRGRNEGFMQVSHGKAAPLRRIAPGEGVVYYSPSVVQGKQDRLQSFTAIGTVRDGEPYQGDMGGSFLPFHRDVDRTDAAEMPIARLLCNRELTAGTPNWGYHLRFGLLHISGRDFGLIAAAMGAALPGVATH